MSSNASDNRKQRRITQSKVRKEPRITYGGRSYSVAEAFLLAVEEENKRKNFSEALALYRLILAKVPDHGPCLNNMGLLLYHFGEVDQAIAAYRRSIQLQPHEPFAYCNLGTALASKGDSAEAEKMFSKAIALKPDFARSIYLLAQMRKYRSIDHADAQHIQKLLAKPEHTLVDAPHLYFALAKIYDDSGLYDQAFEYFCKANRLLNATVTYDPGLIRRLTDEAMAVYSNEFLAQSFPFASDNAQPVFIVGMPRSGTTLLASILSSHRDVKSAGELPTMAECTLLLPSLLGGNIPYPQAARHLTPQAATVIIKQYHARLTRGIRSSVRYVIDKHPVNFRYLGLISMLFPRARIIHCMRHPLDTCLSNYFQYFDRMYDYSFDLKNIGHFYQEYQRHMAHWRATLPMKILDIGYEDMVADTQKTARRALDFLGLEWDARCLAPHTNTQPVRTSSMWQVRQPIYTHSVQRWRHYEKHLDPLKAMLNPESYS